MKPITPYFHGCLDYLVGLLLLVSPWLFAFHTLSSSATSTMVAIGIVVLVLSIVTDYPLGLLKAVPFKVHGGLETAGAIVLLVSPWLAHYSALAAPTSLAIGVGIVWLIVVALTNYTYVSHRTLMR